mmetsp:Transcript_16062/g.37870  ORF Transcript_16062/g.37870 Transcript_16062/m.37870 type:complete len:237 (-) Transcript_16062:646-1356(-)
MPGLVKERFAAAAAAAAWPPGVSVLGSTPSGHLVTSLRCRRAQPSIHLAPQGCPSFITARAAHCSSLAVFFRISFASRTRASSWKSSAHNSASEALSMRRRVSTGAPGEPVPPSSRLRFPLPAPPCTLRATRSPPELRHASTEGATSNSTPPWLAVAVTWSPGFRPTTIPHKPPCCTTVVPVGTPLTKMVTREPAGDVDVPDTLTGTRLPRAACWTSSCPAVVAKGTCSPCSPPVA